MVLACNAVLTLRWNTVLVGGYPEPLYTPGTAAAPARIQFTRDYIQSALHELAHWCLAGAERRQLVDYGYWYRPDGRNAEEQAEFFRAEVRPQALELAFSQVLGLEFSVSCDNLHGEAGDGATFEVAVRARKERYDAEGYPPRAVEILAALRKVSQR